MDDIYIRVGLCLGYVGGLGLALYYDRSDKIDPKDTVGTIALALDSIFGGTVLTLYGGALGIFIGSQMTKPSVQIVGGTMALVGSVLFMKHICKQYRQHPGTK
jgi:hypothetical protein